MDDTPSHEELLRALRRAYRADEVQRHPGWDAVRRQMWINDETQPLLSLVLEAEIAGVPFPAAPEDAALVLERILAADELRPARPPRDNGDASISERT